MVISSFISSILILVLGIWAYMKLESTMNIVAEKQLIIEPSRFSYKMWKDMPVTMYQSFTFFNLTNWNQVKSIGQKPKFVEVGPFVYRTVWSKSDINFLDNERLVSYAERKQWIFQPQLSKGSEDDLIWTINTPLMTALALIQNAPVITRNIVSVILDGLGEGAFIKRNIRSLLFEGYSDLIVSVGPLFDRRFSNFNGKFAYLYNKNDSVDGIWTVSTGTEDLANLNKITRYQSNIVNMTTFSSGQLPQGLNEVKAECAPAWSLDQSTNGQLFTPFNREVEELKLQQQLQQVRTKQAELSNSNNNVNNLNNNNINNNNNNNYHNHQQSHSAQHQAYNHHHQAPLTLQASPKRFFSRSINHDVNRDHHQQQQQQQAHDLIPNPFLNQKAFDQNGRPIMGSSSQEKPQLKDVGKFIFYPDLCRPIHLLPSKQEVSTSNGIRASRYYIDPRVFMNSSQIPSNRCYEMNPRPALANALAATINSVTGANVAVPNLVTGASSPFAMFIPPNNHHHHHNHHNQHNSHHHNHNDGGLSSIFERSNSHQQAGGSILNNAPISRLGRVRQLFSNIVSQRMSAASPGSLLPSLVASGPASLLIGNHFNSPQMARNSPDEQPLLATGASTLAGGGGNLMAQQHQSSMPNQNYENQIGSNRLISIAAGNQLQQPAAGALASASANQAGGGGGNFNNFDPLQQGSANPVPIQSTPPVVAGGSDRWITQFRFKWPKGVFSIGQCQLGAPIYASLPHFLDADEYYLEQVDGLRPNRSLHEFYIDVESTLHSIPVNAKARLQLNVATPELRFRNIPNAMIPVLWQEVTFDIDKPVATMLYWSFTMSPTIYKVIPLLLLAAGFITLTASLISCVKKHKRKNKIDTQDGQVVEGQRCLRNPIVS